MNTIGYLPVEFMPGSTIAECCKEACRLASQLQFGVTFNFNSVEVFVSKTANPEVLRQRVDDAMGSVLPHKVACA